MPMHATKPLVLIILLIVFVGFPAVAQQTSPPAGAKAILDKGVELFGQDKYREALDLFGKVLSDPKATIERPEAAYWSILAYLAVGDQATAQASIDAFIAAYPTSPRLPDLTYQRGRILYSKGDYEGALKVFAAFSSQAPKSDLMPSALYWSGECLYALGRLEDAERTFTAVVQVYPSSVKAEAATYRISLIGLEYRQRELLKLLTWSHEESLRAAEDFRRREKAYEASIALYQRQIADSKRGAAGDQAKTIVELRAQVADLGSQLAASEAKLASAQAEADSLRASLAASQGTSDQAGSIPLASALAQDSKAQALDAKARALDLLDFYIERLAATKTTAGPTADQKDVSK
jgi:outer membrane protein assembly factor BamD (BamD/ComL family)